jgi:hypothetical protein
LPKHNWHFYLVFVYIWITIVVRIDIFMETFGLSNLLSQTPGFVAENQFFDRVSKRNKRKHIANVCQILFLFCPRLLATYFCFISVFFCRDCLWLIVVSNPTSGWWTLECCVEKAELFCTRSLFESRKQSTVCGFWSTKEHVL